jgi:hypothetical protein
VFIRQNGRWVLRWRFKWMARTWLQWMARFGASGDCWLGDSDRMFGIWVEYIELGWPIWAAGRAFVAQTSLLASVIETSYTISCLYQMFFVFWEQIIPYVGKTGVRLSNLRFACFMLPFEVIFPQMETAAARAAVLSFQCILLHEPG